MMHWLPPLSRRTLLGLAAGSALAFGERRARAEEARRVVLVPLGAVSALETQVVEAALRAFYAVEVRVAPRVSLPRSAYYAQRGRYRAERLLTELEKQADESAFRILGLASVDISTTKGDVADWGILGLATIDGRVGVLSSFRCRRKAQGPQQVAHRLGKTAVHELGHTFGLEHCPNVGCVMEDGKGSVLTSDREYDLCDSCRARLEGPALLRMPRETPPWPKPA
jgi:archaemetzincin